MALMVQIDNLLLYKVVMVYIFYFIFKMFSKYVNRATSLLYSIATFKFPWNSITPFNMQALLCGLNTSPYFVRTINPPSPLPSEHCSSMEIRWNVSGNVSRCIMCTLFRRSFRTFWNIPMRHTCKCYFLLSNRFSLKVQLVHGTLDILLLKYMWW